MQPFLSRRRFLQGTAAVGAATALGACTDDPQPSADPTTTGAPPSPTAKGTLVLVTLYGGNDALNTVVPIDDPAYARQRGALALTPDAVHPLDDGFALHPALGRTAGLWADDRLAIVHGVGFEGLDRSHFHCMDEWQSAGEDHTSGWLGRWLDRAGDDPTDAIVVGRQLPLLARGQQRSASVVPAGPFALPGDAAVRSGLEMLADGDRPPLEALVAGSGADLLRVADAVGPLVAAAAEDDTLTGRLGTVATLIEADLPTRAYAVDLDGFDTHANQLATHAALLGELDAALGDFLGRMGARPVTVVVYSEFGRRVVPNGSGGTDHGAAGTLLLAGHVRGGHHGEPSPLDRLADGDLVTTTDFRSVYGGLLEDVLGVPARDVLTAPPAPLALV